MERTKGHHEQIISVETYWRNQERRKGAALAPARKNIGQDFALRGFVTCHECGVPLRSCWSKGKTKHHPYYLCQTKTCAHYGKSIRRDKLEGEFGDLLHQLEPNQTLFDVAKAMFRDAWTIRSAQAKQDAAASTKQISEIEKQIDTLLGRIVETESTTVIKAYESKIEMMERQKMILQEKQREKPALRHSFDDMLELSLQFLAKPWKLWETGDITLQRTLLKLAFTDRLGYCSETGPRTPKFSLPFKALSGFTGRSSGDGGGAGT